MGARYREQLMFSRMERNRRRGWTLIWVLVVGGILAAVVFCMVAKYRPPEHDPMAKEGIPKPAEEYMYGTAQTEYNYVVGMAANLYQQENGDVYIYFTNSIANDVYLRCEIIDRAKNKVLYRTGYIEPGEYIETVNNSRVANQQYDVTVKVYAYTKGTFTSEGTTELSLKLQPW